ncbi:Transposase, IS4-like [Acididesulfobacillus acetoxydans]|uniref:Transposase, IS4-like n=1 Tax=Acididesulfobacillus acetoxydans TaxID=1561005 RepID=A0A8S0XW95_9FIRM|nr:IS1634 family transposase [Acididesulfobacillus acetoxydans]CAA7600887.1 Transposase, IS4-like [Acididesulfobacillus acetoxydans]
MYIRVTSRKNKDNSVVKYVQLAHNVRNPETGSPQANVLFNFGRLDRLDMESLRRLERSIRRFLGEPLDPVEAPKPELLSCRPLGGAWFLDQLWRKLGIDSILKRRLKEREYRTEVERALFAMVANRALAPLSKLQLEKWVPEKVVIPGLANVEVQHCYRAMDFLLESQEDVEREVFYAVADLFYLEVDLLFFDTTSTYFEMDAWDDEEQDLKALGHSKDSRPDLPQIVIGLAVTRDGIPIRSWVWPGNTSDMSVIPEVKRDLAGWKLGRVVSVMDRGFSSEENLRILQRTGGHYIAGERLRAGKPEVEEALSHPGRFRTLQENLEAKEVVVGHGEARIRYVLVRNPAEAKRDAHTRTKHLEKLKQKLAKLKELDGEAHTKAHCALYSHIVYKRYLQIDAKGNLRINQKAVKAAERLDGKYLIRTSDDTLSIEDITLGFKQLWEVERAFRTLKTTLELRPVYHRKDDRICAHVLLCWLALLLVRLAEVETQQTWANLRFELGKIYLVEWESTDGKVFQRTELTQEQTGIFSALKLPEPPRIWDISLPKGQKV